LDVAHDRAGELAFERDLVGVVQVGVSLEAAGLRLRVEGALIAAARAGETLLDGDALGRSRETVDLATDALELGRDLWLLLFLCGLFGLRVALSALFRLALGAAACGLFALGFADGPGDCPR
jgi:hypothetical protein